VTNPYLRAAAKFPAVKAQAQERLRRQPNKKPKATKAAAKPPRP
jgi:hypothetical protein